VAWGEYQDYLYGRFDGINHEDEAQTQQNGEKIGHGGDVYYMSPGINYGRFLCVGVQRALDAGVEAVHLEEPEFWVRAGYSEGFKREWKDYYHEDWQPPYTSPDAQWRASKLKYFLYRRALQQVFDYVQAYNKRTGKQVKCYVPTHSLLNYAHWQIVSPESSLARLNGCDGYIAQVWTGTSRTPNVYKGVKKERTFETAFLEYGAMQNLVRATGRRVWYLADPVEDDASHDWGDYRRNWQSTLVASLLQPEVWRYEIMPWPERVWQDSYPSEADPTKRVPIPDAYANELQVVVNALKDMNQKRVEWQAGTRGIGVLVSDSLMFQRGEPNGSDGDMSHIYGLALPFLERGIPVQPIQLENVTLKGYLSGVQVLLASYEGQKPLTPEVNEALAAWVRGGGKLVFVDNDKDLYNKVRDWWNSDGRHYDNPRQHLFELIGSHPYAWLKDSPSALARESDGAASLVELAKGLYGASKGSGAWQESSSLVLRRGPYVIASALDDSPLRETSLSGRFLDLFNPESVQTSIRLKPGARHFLVDLEKQRGTVIAASGQVVLQGTLGTIEGVSGTNGLLILRALKEPRSVTVDGAPAKYTFDASNHVLWVRFSETGRAQAFEVR
jgi:hypothetical protein